MKSRKSQITIFVILAILLLFLILFLVFRDSGDKIKTINDESQSIKQTAEVKYVKNIVDECLSKELKKATIISGLRGGFIYDKDEFYFPGTIPDETYSPKLLSNLGLNWNNLQSRVLVHSQVGVFQPGFKENVKFNDELYYEHSIEEDMEKYVLIGFMKCLDFSDYEDNKFKLDYDDYIGRITYFDIDSNLLEVEEMDGEINDDVELNINGKEILGYIKDIKSDGKLILEFTGLNILKTQTAQTIKSLDIINLNKKANLSITINDNYINSKIIYPINIENNNNQTSTFKDSSIDLNVMYGGLMEMSKVLLNYKYAEQKDIDYTKGDNVEKILNNEKKGSEYYKYLKNKNLELKRKILRDDKEHKQYIYSLIDYNSKILNEPFVLNFGYENIAPQIDMRLLSNDFVLDDDEKIIYLFATKDKESKYNLRDFTFEYQYRDYYTFYFNEINYNGGDAKIILTQEGELSFTPYQDKVYTYNIELSDNEANRDYQLYFVTALPDNTNNNMASKCIKYTNFEDSDGRFPLENAFKHKFEYENSGEMKLFGYQIIAGNDIPKSRIEFSKTCIFDPNKFTARITFSKNGGVIRSTNFDFNTPLTNSYSNYIEVPQENGIVDIDIEITELGRTEPQTDSFKMSIYSATCLGPFPESEFQDEYGGDLTCCNLNDIANVDTQKIITPPKIVTNIYDSSNNHKAFDADMYFIVDVQNMDLTNSIIWNIDPKITSLFSSRLVATCNGLYANPFYNLDSLNQGNINLGKIEEMKFLNEDVSELNEENLLLNIVEEGSECKFGYFKKDFPLKIKLNNGVLLKSGLKNMNLNDYGVAPIGNDNDDFILCDDNHYESEIASDDINGWEKIISSVQEGNYKSKGYCYQNVNACLGRVGSPTFE